jgi:hypothetical protein
MGFSMLKPFVFQRITGNHSFILPGGVRVMLEGVELKIPPGKPDGIKKIGNVLLSHKRSTIGANGLNFSVRNGKRWFPNAIVT